MSRKAISKNVERRLYAESMGKCMNPDCQADLFVEEGDIMERAHIDPYCKTADNLFENLVVLCPNCHTNFDKNAAFTPNEVLSWKQKRREELEKLFSKKFNVFNDLKAALLPLLLENKMIYEKYYLCGNKKLWDKFEFKILINNKKIKTLLENNLNLIQTHKEPTFSNLAYVQNFLLHIEEFEATRGDEEKNRQVLFPTEINSMFGITPVSDSMLPSTESLEALITKLYEQGQFGGIMMGINSPFFWLKQNEAFDKVYLDDTPRIRQMYFEYDCFKKCKVRLNSLNYALQYIKQRHISFEFLHYNNLREIRIKNNKIIFVYEYCLSEVDLIKLAPEENSVIVNLHNWNGDGCISQQAYALSEEMDVTLLTMKKFYKYINEINNA